MVTYYTPTWKEKNSENLEREVSLTLRRRLSHLYVIFPPLLFSTDNHINTRSEFAPPSFLQEVPQLFLQVLNCIQQASKYMPNSTGFPGLFTASVPFTGTMAELCPC
jgi:hypothetical protein